MLMTTELDYNKRQIYEEKTKLKKNPITCVRGSLLFLQI